jgi:TusA-related sulfurtransferase
VKPPVARSLGMMICSGLKVAAVFQQTVYLDLRGVKCPLNWARAKVRLEQMRRHEVLELMLDDPRGVRDIPAAAEAEGYAVLECTRLDGVWRMRIER